MLKCVTTAVPFDRLTTATGPFEYHVSIHHFDNREDYFVRAFRLSDPLPTITIPLLPGDPAVSLVCGPFSIACLMQTLPPRNRLPHPPSRTAAAGRAAGVGRGESTERFVSGEGDLVDDVFRPVGE
jgi:hypothetical protein